MKRSLFIVYEYVHPMAIWWPLIAFDTQAKAVLYASQRPQKALRVRHVTPDFATAELAILDAEIMAHAAAWCEFFLRERERA